MRRARLIFASLALGGAFLLGYHSRHAGEWPGLPPALEATPAHARSGKFPAMMMREFSRVYDTVQEQYVDEVDPDRLIKAAIRGMVDSLDPYSVYFDEEDFRSFEESISGQFGGIGIYVDVKSDLIYVVSPIEGTPAHRAGIRAGDFIIELNGESARGIALRDAIEIMRGEPGTVLNMKVARRGAGEQMDVLEFDLERAVIQTPSVRAALAERDIGYVRITQFQPMATVSDLVRHLNRLQEENGRRLRGLLLDMRNNPGGDLGASIGVSSVFLEPALEVVSNRSRNGTLERHSAGDQFHNPRELDDPEGAKAMKMVVLVNGGSASASEIVAGALQDHKRAVVVGTRTYGKATVQRVIPLNFKDRRSAVKLTTARYYTPAGRSIQSTGIEPDMVIEQEAPEAAPAEDPAHAEQAETDTEADADADRTVEEISKDLEENDPLRTLEVLPDNDAQYGQALDILRTMSLVAGEQQPADSAH